jgi:DNA-directed RNA polymerase I, II, and III subunit RPABC1
MHILQPKHTKLSEEEVKKVLDRYNISLAQLPKISSKDAAVPEGSKKGDVIKIERASEVYHRVVI